MLAWLKQEWKTLGLIGLTLKVLSLVKRISPDVLLMTLLLISMNFVVAI